MEPKTVSLNSKYHLKSESRLTNISLLLVASTAFLSKSALSETIAEEKNPPIIPGLVDSSLDKELQGLVLIEELNCVACHQSDAPFAIRSKKAPRLSKIGDRVNPEYLEAFIANPHGTKPGTTMPDLPGELGDEKKTQSAKALTHFLLSLKEENDFHLQTPDSVAANLGEKLFHSKGCVACHSPRDAKGNEVMTETSAPLGELHKKYNVKSLVSFLNHPHASRPSGRMPNMQLQGRESQQIAHYLVRETQVPGNLSYTMYRGQVWEGLDSDAVSPEKAGHVKNFELDSFGKVQHQTAIKYEGWLNINQSGPYTFFAEMNGGSLKVDGEQLISEEPSNRRGPKKSQGTGNLKSGWRKIELTYFHTGRDPIFSFMMEGPQFDLGAIPPSMLSTSNRPVRNFEPPEINAEVAIVGRKQFSSLGCASCHDDIKVQATPALKFSKLNTGKGCLSGSAGHWPDFHLSKKQRALIAAALPQVESKRLNDREQIKKSMITFNCIACHDRDGLGGVDPQRNEFFTGTHPELGDQGRLPPPLSHVGAKLTPDWISEVLLKGNRQRRYLDSNMPQYGEANVGHLVELFGKVDSLEAVTFPKISNIQESKNAGYEMMGTEGFSCIACHDFNGQKSAGAGALDIVHVTERLQKNWFHLYMRNPARFHSTVIMPSYWPGNQSVRPDVLGGDSAQQIEALWAYLEDGTRAKKPIGLSRQSNELRVADVAEIARGRGTAGYRGIGVGYPERINLAFDSEEMALRLLWKGDFANVNHGSFRARGSNPIAFPPGIPFHRLQSMDADWPYKGKTDYTFPKDHGYQFRGYELDSLRRPTFKYQFGDIRVEDFFEDVTNDKDSAKFIRTFTFDSPKTQPMFYFRAASGKRVKKMSDREFQIDDLEIKITSEKHEAILREGDPEEVLIPLTLPRGSSTLTLEYKW